MIYECTYDNVYLLYYMFIENYITDWSCLTSQDLEDDPLEAAEDGSKAQSFFLIYLS